MSHIVSIRTEVRDPVAVQAACRQLGLPQALQGTARLFAGQQATGLLVQLPGWRYPVVCDTATGQVHFDNFSGQWGDQARLNQLLQAYAVEKAKLEARKRGHSVAEQPLADGSVKLTIELAGGAA